MSSGSRVRVRPRGRSPRSGSWLGLGVVLGLLIAAPAPGARAESMDAMFKRANEAYFKGDFQAAADVYDALVAAGVRDPDVYFNQGTAHARRGALGYAILAFERAAALSPGDEEVERSLAQAREAVGKRLADRHGEATVRTRPPIREALVRPFSANLLAWLLLLCNAGLFGCLLARGATKLRHETARLGLAVASAVLALLTLLTGAGLAVKVGVGQPGQAAIVVAAETSLREGPDAAAQPRGEVGEGSLARVLGREGAWARVRVRGGAEGWVEADHVGTIELD